MAKKSLRYSDALASETTDKRLDILRRIGETGSISEAARQAGVSYKGAWQAIDTLSNLAGLPLLERSVGGSGGGGAQLTESGKQLIAAAAQLSAAKAQILKNLRRDQGTSGLAHSNLAALGLRTSMRNQLPCVVNSIRKVGQATAVELQLSDGTPLRSRITAESAELLGLSVGKGVLALFKATAVTVSISEPTSGARNVLSGAVTRASRAIGGGEVSVQLPCGLQVVGFSGPEYGLKVRATAFAALDESAVVIALAE